jgi:hypothetical protein
MKKREGWDDRLPKLQDIINVRYRPAINPTGKPSPISSSEGSLNQHLKIKHPDIFKNLVKEPLGTNQPVKESDEEN